MRRILVNKILYKQCIVSNCFIYLLILTLIGTNFIHWDFFFPLGPIFLLGLFSLGPIISLRPIFPKAQSWYHKITLQLHFFPIGTIF
jgi:hypothetical protein